jgi:osmoprotectant transport system substrate-binding protein
VRTVRGGVVALLAVVVVAASCGSDPAPPAVVPGTVRVAAFDFAESELLAEIYAQALEGRGMMVERLGRVGSREVVLPALQLGLIDVVPEYAGSMLAFVSLGTFEPRAETPQTVSVLRVVLGQRDLEALVPATAQNRNAVVVTATLAAEHGLRRVSDLGPIASRLAFGGPRECPERLLCLIGLRTHYGLEFGSFTPLPGSAVVAAALRSGEIDVGLLFSTDPVLVGPELVLLEDDRGLQPAENVIPVVRSEALTRWGPELAEVLDEVSVSLDTQGLVLLNSRMEGGESPAALAAEWLRTRPSRN